MAFAAFYANPIQYLRTHRMGLNGSGEWTLMNAGAVTFGAAVANPASGHSITYTHNSNVTYTQAHGTPPTTPIASGLRRMHLAGRRDMTYVPAAGGGLGGLRILPWREAHVAELQLAGGATLALTGPLTGCTVAVARIPGAGVWLYHANISAAGGVSAVNIATKRAQIAHLVGGHGGGGGIAYCESGPDYVGVAFAFARLVGGNWRLYVHEYGGANGTRTHYCGQV